MSTALKEPESEIDLDQVSAISPEAIITSPENDVLYRRPDQDDPDFRGLVDSIQEHGVQEPLVLTADDYLVSGHRRREAAIAAGLDQVPVRRLKVRRDELSDEDFVKLLREHNRQRVKSFAEQAHEAAIDVDPDIAYQSLIGERHKRRAHNLVMIDPGERNGHAPISKAKEPFLQAIKQVVQDLADFLPLSVRQVHYRLLNDPPLIHASKPGSRYANNVKSYRALVDLLSRARKDELIDEDAIDDATRPTDTWSVWPNPAAYLRDHLEQFGRGYSRDLMQSQPAHFEIVCEKNTVFGVLSLVAMKYGIPITSGRGYVSRPAQRGIANRFSRSGKARLVLFVLSDHDPEGIDLGEALVYSLKTEHRLSVDIEAIRVGVNSSQVEAYGLAANAQEAKTSSPRYKKYVRKHGRQAWELEAFEPDTLQSILADAIDRMIDVEAFNWELSRERIDAAHLEAVRRVIRRAVAETDLEGSTS